MNPSPPTTAILRETCFRDGLQSVQTIVSTEDKIAWLTAAHAAGMREAEVGAFVPPRLLPQLADTACVVAAALRLPGLQVSALVPNLKGAERALDTGVHQITIPVSASVLHSRANLRKEPDAVVAEVRRICALRDASGSRCRVEGGVGTAFGCTLQGQVDEAEVLRLLHALLDAGVDCVSLADTVGYADPAAVERLFAAALDIAGERLYAAHFHDTRGLGLANVYAAWRAGVRRFDTSLAGIGGCPHAPGASGNVSTEDVAFMMERMGVHTGLDLRAQLGLRSRIAAWLPGEELHGVLWRAGLPGAPAQPSHTPQAPQANLQPA